jgi:hypothetical protein
MKCKRTKKNGETCKARALIGTNYCYFHSNIISKKEKKEVRSRGGKHKLIKCTGLQQNEINSIQDVKKLLSSIINGIISNEIDIRAGTSISYICSNLIKCIEVSEIEKRIEILEKILSQNINNKIE